MFENKRNKLWLALSDIKLDEFTIIKAVWL